MCSYQHHCLFCNNLGIYSVINYNGNSGNVLSSGVLSNKSPHVVQHIYVDGKVITNYRIQTFFTKSELYCCDYSHLCHEEYIITWMAALCIVRYGVLHFLVSQFSSVLTLVHKVPPWHCMYTVADPGWAPQGGLINRDLEQMSKINDEITFFLQ